MTVEPYKPPQADLLLDADRPARQFYVVSARKLAALFLATFGLYAVYWFYKNWRYYRDALGEKIMPIPRAIFFIFFTHSLFARVDGVLKQNNVEYEWAPRLLASLFVIVSIASNILDRLSYREIGSPWTDILSLVILPVALVILLKAQAAINVSQDDPEGASNSRFTLYNYIWIVLGVLLWMFVAFGLLVIMGAISFEA